MIAAAMPAAMRPYSMAVAPDSSARNWRSFAIMSRTIRPGSKGFLKMTCDEKKPRRLAGASLYCPRLRHNPERRHDKRQRLAVRFGSSVRAIHGQFRIISAIAPIATECFGAGKRRYVPIATDAPQQTAPLFDHIVGGSKQRWRNSQAERLGGLKVDHKLELRRIRAVFVKCLDRTRIAAQSCPSQSLDSASRATLGLIGEQS